MTVLVVPWRDRGDPARKRNLQVVCDHLYRADLGPVFMSSDGRNGDAPFNRSAAYNRAVAAHPGERVFVFNEADLLVPAEQLRAAVLMAGHRRGLVVPFEEYRYLSEPVTAAVWRGAAGDPFTLPPLRVMPPRRAVGACNVVSALSLDAVGCWDEAFEGWGWDDRAMAHGFTVATGCGTRFVPGPAVHLYHPPAWQAGTGFAGGGQLPVDAQARTRANRDRYRKYLTATKPRQIQKLTRGG